MHNLSIAASSKEPRDEDRFKTRGGAGDDDDDDDDDDDAKGDCDDSEPMLSLVNHPTWEGILRALFHDVERLVGTRESAATGGMRSVRRARRARALAPTTPRDTTRGSTSVNAGQRRRLRIRL